MEFLFRRMVLSKLVYEEVSLWLYCDRPLYRSWSPHTPSPFSWGFADNLAASISVYQEYGFRPWVWFCFGGSDPLSWKFLTMLGAFFPKTGFCLRELSFGEELQIFSQTSIWISVSTENRIYGRPCLGVFTLNSPHRGHRAKLCFWPRRLIFLTKTRCGPFLQTRRLEFLRMILPAVAMGIGLLNQCEVWSES